MTTSAALMVRDAIFDRVKTFAFFKNFTFSKTRAFQVQPDKLPFCGIYFVNELMIPDGDANVGEVRFRTSVRVGFSIIIQNNNADAAEATLDQALTALLGGLFSDTTLTAFSAEPKIQGFSHGERSHVFGAVGMDNETPVAELQFDLTVDLGVTDYAPYVPDDLETIHVTGRPSLDPDTPLVEREWDVKTE